MKTIKIYYNKYSENKPTKPIIATIKVKNDEPTGIAIAAWIKAMAISLKAMADSSWTELGDIEIIKIEVVGSPFTKHYDKASKIALQGTESQSKGGLTSSANMSASERSERAKKAAASRWNKR